MPCAMWRAIAGVAAALTSQRAIALPTLRREDETEVFESSSTQLLRREMSESHAAVPLVPPKNAAARLYPGRSLKMSFVKGSANPLSSVLLILGHPRLDRAELLRGYSDYFYDVWYLQPPVGLNEGSPFHTPCNFTGNLLGDIESMSCLSDLVAKLGTVTQSLHKQTSYLGASKGVLDGVLYMHFDFWFNPMLFAHAPLNKQALWRPRFGLERNTEVIRKRCLRGQALWNDDENHGGWYNDYTVPGPGQLFRQKGLTAVSTALNLSLKAAQGWNYDELCYGWADLMYLPRSAWHSFSELVPVFKGVFHEVALPTIQSMLVRSNVVPHEELLDCWGSCCKGTTDSELLHKHMCGHKMNLVDEGMRKGLVAMLQSR